METQPHGQLLSELPTGRLFASVPEATKILGYDKLGRTVRKGIANGEIPAIRVGATYRIPLAWIREQALLGTAVMPNLPQD
jgi:excisionase family DNA binding protein